MAIASPATDVRVSSGDPIAQITAAVSAEAPVARVNATPWERHYVTVAVVLDTVIGFFAASAAYAAWPGEGAPPTLYFALTLLFPLIWVSAIAVAGGYEKSRLSVGPEEFNRVGLASLGLLATAAILAWSLSVDVARGYVAITLLAATASTMVARYGLRKYVHHQRRHGRFQRRTVLVGTPVSVSDLSEHLHRFEYHGFAVVASYVTNDRPTDPSGLGPVEDVLDAIRHSQADSVAVTSDHGLTHDALQHLAWQLERIGTSLYVAPSLMDVAGPRLSVQPIEGVSLLRVERPTFTGVKRLVKEASDVVLAAVGLVALTPVLLVIAAAIKLDTPGPVLFRQTRIGRHGQPFKIAKFRSMVVDAEDRRSEVQHLNEVTGPLFKSRHDPRVTRVGAFLRRTSLDELPQLWNVLMGDMSLVGPRPHLPDEVVTFDLTSRRRLFVKPGITGMWQISGRSDLSWEESVRADLRYVENWTLGLDALIMWKTVGVVLQRKGAY